ncbi:MAG: hypothetical protein JO306_13070 [Gemmatimonadetes bacterium]|nr:hypothetical protein [Gemmatimonadota bacterium]
MVVALALAEQPNQTFAGLAARLHLSAGYVHGAVRRLRAALLLVPGTRKANLPNLTEFVVHGVQYAFYPVTGGPARGVPTAHSAAPMQELLLSGDDLVWPSGEGTMRGNSIVPLYPGAPRLLESAPRVYEALTVIDTLRVGQARERELARDWLARFIGGR